MNDEPEGLMASAEIESEDSKDNQQADAGISHIKPDTEPTLESTTVAAEGEETEFERPDWYPEKFWNEDEGPDLENLVKSYNELQKKFSQGKHKAPEEYDVSAFQEANIPEDDELFNTYKDWAKQNGISQAAFEELASKFVDMAGNEAQQAEVSYQEEYKKLGNNADAIIKSMSEWGQSLVRKGVWGNDDFEEFKIMGGTAQGIRALQKIRSYYGDRSIPIEVGQPEGAPSKEELTAMVGKPEYLNDPTYRAKVEKMFEKMYGTQDYQAM